MKESPPPAASEWWRSAAMDAATKCISLPRRAPIDSGDPLAYTPAAARTPLCKIQPSADFLCVGVEELRPAADAALPLAWPVHHRTEAEVREGVPGDVSARPPRRLPRTWQPFRMKLEISPTRKSASHDRFCIVGPASRP